MTGLTFEAVHDAARGRWPEILVGLGIDAATLRDRHGPCPGCGGRDRFRFDDKGVGRFICGRGGDALSGDGFGLLQHVHGWTAREALERVGNALGIETEGSADSAPIAAPRAPVKPTQPTRTEAYAREVWARAVTDDPVAGSHPYAISKGITWAAGAGRTTASGKIIGRDADCLVIPIRSMDWSVIAVQCINPAGAKQTFGSMGDDGCLLLGNTLDRAIPWMVAEGWADAVSLVFHHYEGNAVAAAAFGIRRMERVAHAIAEHFQPDELVILEDAA
ncbi:primase-helicase zinc-binding domain-containing protein [Thioalkalivibrio sp. ALE11]|uniref:primase-helicase zinc-binding domain-containing protein n=1 Tax=Thioalkalivibrio sp. ALE11 TaxID=1265494 RepID=UPI0003813BCD|nr:primase-helicase zinc-binding domain-containing protein [Thioalkalivibrio sp. ALE11]